MIGTLSYMAPEQCRGEHVDGRTDLFATGAVLHELLTGVKAFPGSSDTEVMQRLLFQPPAALQPLDSRIPAPLAAVIAIDLVEHHGLRRSGAQRGIQCLHFLQE